MRLWLEFTFCLYLFQEKERDDDRILYSVLTVEALVLLKVLNNVGIMDDRCPFIGMFVARYPNTFLVLRVI